jgi:2-polyprenyl-3-methyl-5-hydroxy-6-metoxy-1,4-benzoquinol methylase
MRFLQQLLPPPKYFYAKKYLINKNSPVILDVGSGNHSPSKTKYRFPNCNYTGIDLDQMYNYDEQDKIAIDDFYSMDISKCAFEAIPNNKFDLITMAHIIEHVPNGEDVLAGLSTKMKSGGVWYIEFPGPKSAHLPSMKGTLNFYDDSTHARIYSANEIANILEKLGFTVLEKGTRRYWRQAILSPYVLLREFFSGRGYYGPAFWDWLGFADYVVARKN